MLHKPKLFQLLLSLLLIWLSACNGGSQGGVSPAVVSSEPTAEEEISLRFDLSDDPSSRWQEITLTVTDQEGNPLANQQVHYSQKDLDFLFSIEYGGMEPEMFANEGYADLFWDLGINAFQLSPYHLWYTFEPNDDDFRWWVEYEHPSFCPEVAV